LPLPWRNVGAHSHPALRQVTAEIDGRRVEQDLPGRQGRLLFVYLVANRLRPTSRDELVEALWPEGRDGGLSPLLSKLRRLVELEGRGDVRVVLPDDAWIDVEAATRDCTGRSPPPRAKTGRPPSGDQHASRSTSRAAASFPGNGAHWITETRRRLDGIHARSLELVAGACVRIGGPELDTAERAARELAALEPFRESGQRALMRILDARGNRAEALKVYEQLRTLLRDELGTAPSQATQECTGSCWVRRPGPRRPGGRALPSRPPARPPSSTRLCRCPAVPRPRRPHR
jgi:DNA-binding SARP family transcriptional activator